MLDFSKAFDTVPHQHLLKKLKYYGINGKLYYWLSTWLTKRSQRVVVESKYVRFISSAVADLGGVRGAVAPPPANSGHTKEWMCCYKKQNIL